MEIITIRLDKGELCAIITGKINKIVTFDCDNIENGAKIALEKIFQDDVSDYEI